MGQVYLAGPLFTSAEISFNAELVKYLRLYGGNWDFFLPQEMEQRDKTPKEIFEADIAAIDASEIIFANLDGPDPDSGTCVEIGYGFAKGKKIIGYRTDFRAGGDDNGVNLMCTGASFKFIRHQCETVDNLAMYLIKEL